MNLKGQLIIDQILKEQFDFLQHFSLDTSTLNKWSKIFRKLVGERKIRTADKAKQIYFPMDCSITDIQYHLIVPLFASSLANEIYSIVSDLKNGSKKNEGKIDTQRYHDSEYVKYPNLAVQKFGGKHPRNISMLNASRKGESYLFSTQPPTWKNQIKPPIHKKSLFSENFFNQNMNEDIDFLRDFLLRFELIDLSVKNPMPCKWVDSWLTNIIDKFLLYAESIQILRSGWSGEKGIKLKPEHQYLLDPYRKDEDFQAVRKAIDWQAIICQDFGKWLNRRLAGKDKQFTPQTEHHRYWVLHLKQPLREHSEMLDVKLKFQTGMGA